MQILKYGKPRLAEFCCSWCGTQWRANTSEKGVYKFALYGKSYARMKCPLCAEKYVVGDFILPEGEESEGEYNE